MSKVHWHGWAMVLMFFQNTLHKIPHNQSLFNSFFCHNEMYSCTLLVVFNFGGMVNKINAT
jgi:hypothetical protein